MPTEGPDSSLSRPSVFSEGIQPSAGSVRWAEARLRFRGEALSAWGRRNGDSPLRSPAPPFVSRAQMHTRLL